MLSPNHGRSVMNVPGIADEAQLAVLTKMLDDHCTKHSIASGDPAREELGRRIMTLFSLGSYSFEQIAGMLGHAPEEGAEIIELHPKPDTA
jgi:hypothetical protein